MTYTDKIRQTLEECRAEGRVAAIHLNRSDPATFCVGFIQHTDSEHLSFLSLDSEGGQDGVTTVRLGDVMRVHVNSDYLRDIQNLFENRGRIYTEVDPTEIGAGIRETLEAASQKGFIVTLRDYTNDTITGYVHEVGLDYVELESVIEGGKSDGRMVFPLEDITRVDVAGKTQQSKDFLYRRRLGLDSLS